MKTKRQVFILLVAVLAGILTLSAQNRKEQRAEVVRNIISSKNYKIYVDTYIPPYRDPKQLNYLDSIEIKMIRYFPTSFISRNLIFLIAIGEINLSFRLLSKICYGYR